MQREAIALIFVAVLPERLIVLSRLGLRLLSAGDEGWKPIDVAGIFGGGGGRMLHTRRISLLLTRRMGLLLACRISWLLADVLLADVRLRFARQIGLRLAGAKRHF